MPVWTHDAFSTSSFMWSDGRSASCEQTKTNFWRYFLTVQFSPAGYLTVKAGCQRAVVWHKGTGGAFLPSRMQQRNSLLSFIKVELRWDANALWQSVRTTTRSIQHAGHSGAEWELTHHWRHARLQTSIFLDVMVDSSVFPLALFLIIILKKLLGGHQRSALHKCDIIVNSSYHFPSLYFSLGSCLAHPCSAQRSWKLWTKQKKWRDKNCLFRLTKIMRDGKRHTKMCVCSSLAVQCPALFVWLFLSWPLRPPDLWENNRDVWVAELVTVLILLTVNATQESIPDLISGWKQFHMWMHDSYYLLK